MISENVESLFYSVGCESGGIDYYPSHDKDNFNMDLYKMIEEVVDKNTTDNILLTDYEFLVYSLIRENNRITYVEILKLLGINQNRTEEIDGILDMLEYREYIKHIEPYSSNDISYYIARRKKPDVANG